MNIVSIKNVFVKYTKEFYALSNFSLEMRDGDFVCLLGEKDSGKTSVLRLLAGLDFCDKGEIYINNISIDKIDFKNDINLGFVPFITNFFDKKTVYENLRYVLEIRNYKEKDIEEKINIAITKFKLEKVINEKIYKLNTFQKYVVSMARLSLRELDIVLIDNIFDNLSKDEYKEILSLIKRNFIKNKMIVLMASSDEQIAKKLCNRIITLKYGVIIEDKREQKSENI